MSWTIFKNNEREKEKESLKKQQQTKEMTIFSVDFEFKFFSTSLSSSSSLFIQKPIKFIVWSRGDCVCVCVLFNCQITSSVILIFIFDLLLFFPSDFFSCSFWSSAFLSFFFLSKWSKWHSKIFWGDHKWNEMFDNILCVMWMCVERI